MTNKPEMKAVNSSMVAAIGYDDVHETLWVEFNGGKVYTYANVGGMVHAGMLNTIEKGGSVGQYINSHVKPYFIATKVEG